MTQHARIIGVLDRCEDTTSPLAIFKSYENYYKFNVVFADTVQTQHDIKKNRGFICLFNPNDSLDELEQTLKKSVEIKSKGVD